MSETAIVHNRSRTTFAAISKGGAHPRSAGHCRVMMTADAAGGVWRYAIELTRAISARGFEVVLVGQGPRPSAAQRTEALSIGHLVWIEGPLDWMAQGEGELSGFAAALAALVDEWQPDLLHLNNPSQASDLSIKLPTLVVSHSCVATWWKTVKGDHLPDTWRWQFRRQREGLLRADAVVAPSRSHADMLRATYGALPRLEVVENAVAPAMASEEKERTVFAAARWWDEGKNAAVLDSAAASLSWPVFMAGPTVGPAGGRVDIGHACCEMLDHSAVLEKVSRAGIFVSPSLYEPFGLASLEAASAAAPLVLSDIPTYRELWNEAAAFFDPHDADDLARKIEQLVADPEGRADLGKRALARSRVFSPRIQAQSMAELYEDMLDHSGVRAAAGGRG